MRKLKTHVVRSGKALFVNVYNFVYVIKYAWYRYEFCATSCPKRIWKKYTEFWQGAFVILIHLKLKFDKFYSSLTKYTNIFMQQPKAQVYICHMHTFSSE